MAETHPEFTYGNMVHEYFIARTRQAAQQRLAMLESVRTRKDAEKLRDATKRKIRRCFGPRPARTPLNLRITGGFQREQYSVQNLIYESRPNYPVTANLYRPKGDGPFPAVLGLCGHSQDGKAADVYQSFAYSLASQGYVVLILDPVSQGERGQYDRLGEPVAKCGCCAEHNLAGTQMALLGDCLAMWRTWDAIRGLDVLLGLPEVDKTRVGATGNSGGGTLTTWLNAMEDRLTMAAPSCFVTTFLANLENELPADAEQYPPFALASGIDMADFFIAQAPRPTLLLGQKYDFFDTRGLQQSYQQIKRIYRLLEAEDDIQLFIGPDAHGYSQPNRQAMYRFFQKHTGVKAPPIDAATPPEKPETLFAAPQGQVGNIPNQKWIYELTRQNAQDVAQERKPINGRKLVDAAQRVLNLPARLSVPHYRVLRQRWGTYAEPYQNVQSYAVETEPRFGFVYAILHAWDKPYLLKGKSGNVLIPPMDQALVYLPHVSSRADVTTGQVPVEHQSVYSIDVRGVGMSTSLTCNHNDLFTLNSWSDFMYAEHGWMLGESYLGRRVHDVLCTLDVLAASGVKKVHLCGRGLGATLATFASLLHPLVKQVTLKNALLSFHELTQSPVNLWPLSSLPTGVLKEFDLPDCYRALAKKQLRILEPWDALLRPWESAALKAHLDDLRLPDGMVGAELLATAK